MRCATEGYVTTRTTLIARRRIRPSRRQHDAERIAIAWRTLRRGPAARGMRRYAWAPTEPQLDLGQMDTLDLLVQHGEWTMHEFAMALCIEPSTATRAIARLVDAGLADRSTHPSDKRMTVVRATQDGRAVQKRLALRRLAAVVEALEGFDSGDRRRLADLLERFIAGLDEVVLVRSSTCLPHRQTSSKPLYPSAAHVRHDSA